MYVARNFFIRLKTIYKRDIWLLGECHLIQILHKTKVPTCTIYIYIKKLDENRPKYLHLLVVASHWAILLDFEIEDFAEYFIFFRMCVT